MSKPPFKVVKNLATNTAEIYLYGIIGNLWETDTPITARVIQQLIYSVSEYTRINIHCNGPGGDTLDAIPLANLIKSFSLKQDIHTYNDGICASAMAILLLSVKRENRHGAKGSMAMIHATSTSNWGNSASMQETKEMLDRHDETLASFISDATGMAVPDVVAKWLDGKNHWFTSTEAEAAGLYTVEDYAAVPMPDNVQDMKVEAVAAFYNPKSKITNTDMDIFSTKFKTISALAKVAVAERTAEQFAAVKAELEAEGITGATLVPDVELKAKFEQAEKVPALQGQVTDLGNQVTNLTTEKTTLSEKVTALEAKVAEQAKELTKPAEDAKPPVTTVTDSTGTPPVVNVFETSFDKELKARSGN